jgi:uncharacterized protein YicC (UPF0701 family)
MTDLNAIATTAIADLQTAINALNAQRRQPGADTAAIDSQISALEDQQQGVRDLALQQVEADPRTQAALDAINAAAAQLSQEAAQMAAITTALNQAAQVVNTATTLVTALAPFA